MCLIHATLITRHDLNLPVLSLTRLCILVNNDAQHLLRDLYLVFPQGSLTMVLGPIGPGKSTLLRAMLVEANYRGTTSINASRIAYHPQSHGISRVLFDRIYVEWR